MKHAGPKLEQPLRHALRQEKRPDLAFYAAIITLVLALCGWKWATVQAHRARIRGYLSLRGLGHTAWKSPIRLYVTLVYHAARDLMGFFAAAYPHRITLAPGSESHLQAMRDGPSLFLTAHVHHFEALGSCLKAEGVPLLAIARPMSRARAQRLLIRLRERIGLPVLFSPRSQAASTVGFLRQTLRHVKSGGCLAMLWDQNPPGHAQVTSTFFAMPVRCDSLPVFLHEQNPTMPVYAGYLQPNGQMRLTLLFRGRQKPATQKILRRYHRWLMAVTTKHPGYAYWLLHRRFKTT